MVVDALNLIASTPLDVVYRDTGFKSKTHQEIGAMNDEELLRYRVDLYDSERSECCTFYAKYNPLYQAAKKELEEYLARNK